MTWHGETRHTSRWLPAAATSAALTKARKSASAGKEATQRSQKQPTTWKNPPCTPATLKNKRHSDETKRHGKTLQNTFSTTSTSTPLRLHIIVPPSAPLYIHTEVVPAEPPTWNCPSSFPQLAAAASGSPGLLHPFLPSLPSNSYSSYCFFPFLVLINSCNFCYSSIPPTWLSTVQLAPELDMSTLVVMSLFAANFLPLTSAPSSKTAPARKWSSPHCAHASLEA